MNRILSWLRNYHNSSGWHDSSGNILLRLVIGGMVAYVIVMFFFLGSGVGHQSIILEVDEAAEDGEVSGLILTSIDHISTRIRFDFEVNRQQGMKEIVKCLMFGHEFSYVGGDRSGIAPEIVNMSELPRESLSPDHRPSGSEFTTYRGSGTFYFDTDLRLFPFDKIRWDVSITDDCWDESLEIDETPFSVLIVENQIPDYQLHGINEETYIREQGRRSFILRRNAFLRGLTVVLFLVAFSSSVVLISRARSKAVDTTLLSFFVGLWAVRAILLSPVQEDSLRIFPTLIEVTILFLFCFTVVGIGLIRTVANKPGDE